MKSKLELLEKANAIPIHGEPKNRALVGIDNIENFRTLVIKECIVIVSKSGNSKAEILNNLENFIFEGRLSNEVKT